ncbi:hypothetical protein FGLOB1_2596 [Fusarium globosum]|uniref:Uncharacterized protein n=1 Tax=Fusarium globosum TaxID=78864 RepID=A0A8H5YS38_9HYPO|nr:hypothetical protein FGLOB1_2596 [Fusarium globosum]
MQYSLTDQLRFPPLMGKAVALLVRNANDQATMARTESPRVCSWSYLNSFLAVSVAQDDIRPVKKAKTTTRGVNETVASEARQTHNCDMNHSNAETHAAKPRGARITPSAVKNASAAATMVARIMLENIQRGNEGDVLETRVEDFNAIDHDENPRRNERCEEEEPAFSRGMSQRELPREKSRSTRDEHQGRQRSRMVIQKKQIKTKSSARKSKETSKTDEAIELEMLDEHAMIYSLTEDPDPKIQQCYAYYQQKLKEFPIPSHIFRPPCIPCADLFARMDDDTETGHLCEKQGTGSVQVAANIKACKSCTGRRGPCKMNDMPVLLRGISKLMSEANFYFPDTKHMTPFPTGWVYVEARYFELRSRPDVGFIEAIRATQQCSIKIDGVRSQVEGQVSRIVPFPAGPRQTEVSELEKGRKDIEAQAEEIRRLREESTTLNRRKIEWRDKYHDILIRLDIPDWQTNPIPPPTEEQLDRLLHRTSNGLRRYRWILLSVFSFFLVWLLWTICTICLDWYDASKGIIPFVDLMDEIAENAGFALSVLQLPLYTFVPLQISGALDPLNGVQSSQFAIIEARAPIHEAISNCLEKASQDDRPEDEETKNITRTWVDAYYIRYLDQMIRPEETEPQAALRLTKTYIALIEDAFMTLSDRHPSNFRMADFSQDSLYILEEVPIRMDQLRETIHRFTSSYSAFMEEMSQAIMPLEACREYYKTIE